MKEKSEKPIIPLLQEIMRWIVQTGIGEVIVTPDGHMFLQTCKAINVIYGALDLKKEGKAAGYRIVVRRARKRANDSKYAKLPMLQIYALPAVEKDASTMSDAERRNIEMNTQAVRMAHAVEKDPEQVAIWRERHEAHKRNQEGYKKLYPNFFGFLVATFRMELAFGNAVVQMSPSDIKTTHTSALPTTTSCVGAPIREEMPASDAGATDKEKVTGIRLCVPATVRRSARVARKQIFRPFIRLPMVA